MKIKKLIFIVFALFASFVASADVLRGVNELKIVINDLNEAALRCTLTNDLIDASIRLPLSNSKIKILKENDSSESILYAYVLSFDSGTMCQVYVELSFLKYIPTEKSYGVFWRKNLILSFRKANVAKSVAEDFESLTKQFVSAWLKANPS